jgi:hypothetical protein
VDPRGGLDDGEKRIVENENKRNAEIIQSRNAISNISKVAYKTG